MKCSSLHNKSSEQGSVLLESAIVFPFLAFVLFSFIQWGLIFAAHLTVRNAAEVAVRWAVLNQESLELLSQQEQDDAVEAVADTSLETVLDGSVLELELFNPNYDEPTAPGIHYVALTYDLPLFFSLVVPSSSDGSFTVRASATMY